MRKIIFAKIATGYTLPIMILALSAWLVWDNSRSMMRAEQAGRRLEQRQAVADSMAQRFMQSGNSERAIFLGDKGEWATFVSADKATASLADSLRSLSDDSTTRQKIDTLERLLDLRRENTLRVMAAMGDGDEWHILRDKAESLRRGSDKVVIHPKTADTGHDEEVVYDIVKTKKGFFARLADAFRRQRTDTVAVRRKSSARQGDSVSHAVDIADTVAGVLADISRKGEAERTSREREQAERGRTQKLVGVQLTARISQVVGEIRADGQQAMQAAFKADMQARRNLFTKIIILAVAAIAAVAVLAFYVRRDIRREQEDRERLRLAKAETERVMAQRERLLLTITHDIKAPAAAISGFIELLSAHVADCKGRDYLKSIADSASHLLRLVGALLDYHRLESGKAEARIASFSPAQTATACAEGMMPQAMAKGLSLVCDTKGCDGVTCLSDAFRIRQIMDNLVGNAIKYTDHGTVRLTVAARNGMLLIDVADTGRGMDAQDSRRVFDAFTRLPGAQGTEGVGLGLSIAKEAATLLGGKITLSTVKGKGTTFYVRVPSTPSSPSSPHPVPPRGEGEEKCPEDKSPHPDPPRGEGEKKCPEVKNNTQLSIQSSLPSGRAGVGAGRSAGWAVRSVGLLLLDDDRLQLKLTTEMLRQVMGEGCTITACTTVAEAMDALKKERPSVFFIDIEMPGADGKQVARSIPRQQRPRLVAMTAHDRSIEPQLAEAGFDACLFKPFSRKELREVISPQTSSPINPHPDSPRWEGAEECPDDKDNTRQTIQSPSPRGGSGWGLEGTAGLASLLQYAAGDKEAERELLRTFVMQTKVHAAMLRSANNHIDRAAIGRTAHKALPMMKLIGARTTPSLEALAPERIASLGDKEILQHCNAAAAEMEEILGEAEKLN